MLRSQGMDIWLFDILELVKLKVPLPQTVSFFQSECRDRNQNVGFSCFESMHQPFVNLHQTIIICGVRRFL